MNSLALAAASIAIHHEAHVKKYVAQVHLNRARVYRWLDSRGIPYVPSSANFILTRVGERAPEIAQRLRAKGILVRDWSYDPHLKGYLRFTIGSGAQTRRLLEGLERHERIDRDPEWGKSLAELRLPTPDRMVCMKARQASIHRKTAETDIRVRLNLDGRGRYKVSTGIRFLDHMLELFARHGGFDLEVAAQRRSGR